MVHLDYALIYRGAAQASGPIVLTSVGWLVRIFAVVVISATFAPQDAGRFWLKLAFTSFVLGIILSIAVFFFSHLLGIGVFVAGCVLSALCYLIDVIELIADD